jgi:nucleotide-binding universal stress UspA family protein
VLGSDAEGVLRHSPVPVLMVRSPAPRMRRKK